MRFTHCITNDQWAMSVDFSTYNEKTNNFTKTFINIIYYTPNLKCFLVFPCAFRFFGVLSGFLVLFGISIYPFLCPYAINIGSRFKSSQRLMLIVMPNLPTLDKALLTLLT